ncbi:hypothetical protein H4R26_004114 [Coemansia thaxteri]|uniref:Uncharacterized protein n=1 Tax=Coemansia thaxteri TaxID=2663907 RepID=A0A9W8EIH9_9FUNG|nr:hypothetical protein H4R26_004114 [Coemansia thaxteri]
MSVVRTADSSSSSSSRLLAYWRQPRSGSIIPRTRPPTLCPSQPKQPLSTTELTVATENIGKLKQTDAPAPLQLACSFDEQTQAQQRTIGSSETQYVDCEVEVKCSDEVPDVKLDIQALDDAATGEFPALLAQPSTSHHVTEPDEQCGTNCGSAAVLATHATYQAGVPLSAAIVA